MTAESKKLRRAKRRAARGFDRILSGRAGQPRGMWAAHLVGVILGIAGRVALIALAVWLGIRFAT